VSNLERDPRELASGGLATVSRDPVRLDLAAREVPLGGVRAMVVRRTLPHRDRRTIGAWCFVDDYGPTVPGAGMEVPPHPHTGLQTVTWLLDGQVHHQDSVGSDQAVRPGALSLMTAGRGIAHAETSAPMAPGDRGMRGLQLWVALPEAARHGAPHFEHHDDLPRLADGPLRATVIVGSIGGVSSPAHAYTPLLGAEVSLSAGGAGALPLDPGHEHGVLALDAGLSVDGAALPAPTLRYLGCGRDHIDLAATGSAARLLLLGGAPFEEELLMWWNFVGRTHDEIVAFRDEWEAGRDSGGSRFGRVGGYAGPALAAPPLPGTRLLPRPFSRG
jgi:quercetin 2,3-dioxygenase